MVLQTQNRVLHEVIFFSHNPLTYHNLSKDMNDYDERIMTDPLFAVQVYIYLQGIIYQGSHRTVRCEFPVCDVNFC